MLEGIKVLDCASFIAGPASTTIMADFGAEVIKIESPGRGDPYRKSTSSGPTDGAMPPQWCVDNRNKQGIALDLKAPEGLAVLYRLIEEADVFVTNLPFPVRKRLKIRYEDLAPLNERLIYGSLTAYGETGPDADRPGFDSTALWARSGLMDLVKSGPDAPPARSLPGMGDHPTAVALFAAIMSAMYQREKTGKGSQVSTSLLANGVWWNALYAQTVLSGGSVQCRPAREDSDEAANNLYQTRDNRWIHLSVVHQPERWPAFVALAPDPSLIDQPRFATVEARRENKAELIRLLDQVFAQQDFTEWREGLSRNNIIFGHVSKTEDILEDEQMYESGVLKPLNAPKSGATMTVDSPIWIDGVEKSPAGPAPELGEHTEEILRRYGYDEDAIIKLREAGAIA
jgi:crotonobetainyl-CoA:carnitine CoA-transferase CaiB-like acyl-CoA transferase